MTLRSRTTGVLTAALACLVAFAACSDSSDPIGPGNGGDGGNGGSSAPDFRNQLADLMLPAEAFSIGSRSSPPNLVADGTPDGFEATDPTGITEGLVTDAQDLVFADYPGAVEPGTPVSEAWYSGWTVWSTDGSDSPPAADSADANAVVVRDDVLGDRTFSSDSVYLLDGTIFVGDDCGQDGGVADPASCAGTAATLTVEPGTVIQGLEPPPSGDRASTLVVSRGSRIVADATGQACDPSASFAGGKPDASDVIVMTSNQPAGSRSRGDWGGLVLNGQAPVNTGTEADGEGDSGLFGGSDELDDSGCLRGVRVEFAGDNATAQDQLNGIAFQGTGAGTLVDFVQVHYNQDDGIEPFGGTTSVTHAVMTGIGDDSFDGTDGWRGFWQFGIAQQRADQADNGFELSNNGESPDADPHSSGVVANFTLVGAGVDLGTGEISAEGTESDVGVLLREGSNFRLFNVVAAGFGASGFDVEGAQTASNADARLDGTTDPASTLRLESSILWQNVTADPGDGDDNFADASGDGYTLEENRDFFLSGQDEE